MNKITMTFIFLMMFLMPHISQAKTNYKKTQWAVMQGLDKITGRVLNFSVRTGESIKFGTLTLFVDGCFRTPPIERPESAVLIRVYDKIEDANQARKVFGGWMFASTPSLSGLEHPIYDLILIQCR